MRIAFLGSLNHVTDSVALAALLNELARTRPTRLLLLGGGEGVAALRSNLAKGSVSLEDRGISFDAAERAKLLGSCHFGFNGYRSESEVALSYKSIDYLAAGLPIINNAKGDLWQFVARHRCGINFSSTNLAPCAKSLLACDETTLGKMQQAARALYDTEFSPSVFTQRLEAALKELGT